MYGEEAFSQLDEIYSIEAYRYENSNQATELQINFDKDTRITSENIEQLLLMLSTCEGIVGFEIFGTKERITIQFVCTSLKTGAFKSHIAAYAPGVVIIERPNNLKTQ